MRADKIPLRKRLALKLYGRYKRNAALEHKLSYLFWECTLRCNLSCLHCGSDCTKDSSIVDMPISDFIGVVDDVSTIVNPNDTLIVITGGEPLLRKDLEVVGQELSRRGFPWGIVTNGLLLSAERLRSLLDAGLKSITISLDGLENAHNWLRGNKQSYKRALEAISLLTKVDGLTYDVATSVTRKSYGDLPEMKRILVGLGVKQWRVFTIFPIGRAAQNVDLQLSPNEFKGVLDFIKTTRSEGLIKVSFGCEGFLGSYEGDVRDGFFTCNAGVHVASVLVDGSISACPNLRDNFIQGNIYKDTFTDVWNGRYQLYRDRSWTKMGACAECSLYSYCEGNSLHLRNDKDGSLLFCHVKKLSETQ